MEALAVGRAAMKHAVGRRTPPKPALCAPPRGRPGAGTGRSRQPDVGRYEASAT